jgi:glutaredoxin
MPTVAPEVVFYTRPHCPYSFRLRRALRRRGLPVREVDIWQDAAAAAAVRAVAGGNETVPTVHVGDRWLVNPTADDVCAAAGHQEPHRPRGRGLFSRLRGRA